MLLLCKTLAFASPWGKMIKNEIFLENFEKFINIL